jgi:hypothetical protein
LDTYVEGLVNGYKNDDEEVQRSCLKMQQRRFSHDLWIEANPERILLLQNCTPEDFKRDMAAAPHDHKIHIVYKWYQTTVLLKWEDHVAEFDDLLCEKNGGDDVEQIIEVLAQGRKEAHGQASPLLANQGGTQGCTGRRARWSCTYRRVEPGIWRAR